jgi:hypothetical protein
MEYQKYLKYKTKYLQLKSKLKQLGGNKFVHDRKKYGGRDFSFLITELNTRIVSYVKDTYGLPIRIEKDEVVEVVEQRTDDKSLEIFGKVTKNGFTGWIEMKFLTPKPVESSFSIGVIPIKSSIFEKKQNQLSGIIVAINEANANPSRIYDVSIRCNTSNDKLKSQEKTYLEKDPNNIKKDHTEDSCFLINGDKVILTQILKVQSNNTLFGFVIKESEHGCNGWINIENLETEDSSYGLVKLAELAKIHHIVSPGGRAM